jgi:hypothetical protein
MFLQEKGNRLLMDFAKKVKLATVQADVQGRGKTCTYVFRKNHPAGCINLAAYWASIGHPVSYLYVLYLWI